jgi:two-component system sensor histidine kinase/response regulator
VVTDGRAAVAAAVHGQYALILMDCQMPEMDGFEATAVIRAMEAETGRRRLPIVAMTASAMADDREACLRAGMDDFLTKPVMMEGLQEVIERWLDVTVPSIAHPEPTLP